MKDAPDPRTIDDKLAMIAEKITANPALVDALAIVFGYEASLRAPTADSFRTRLKHPADIAHAQTAFEFGEEAGFSDAFDLLTDGAAIAARRETIQTQLEQEKQVTDAG
jgi:hypothetical protein